MAEVRIQAEGSLWWVQASGSGNVWATASAPASGLMAYMQSFTYISAQTIATISDRGVPIHHKVQSKQPITLNPQFLWTGTYPTALTASGASVPLFHLEFKATQPEIANGTGRYLEFLGAAMPSLQFTEQPAGDQVNLQFVCLGLVGPTGSGYLS